ncbi:MAG: c-type cytochrome [Vulcanimicrobiaceae bacterium]
MNTQRIVASAVLALTILVALAPLVRGAVGLPTAQHHLLHAMLIAGALISAILFATPSRDVGAGHYGWLLVAIFSPLAAMLLMWPSEYTWFERHPAGHAVEHLGLVALGFVTAYAGQRYAAGIGWASGLSLLFMALASAWGFGVAPATTVAATASSVPQITAVSDTGGVSGAPDPARGSKLFSKNCAVCHGAHGAGGDGPSLKGEKTRKDLRQAQQWIMNPNPPMPKLFPETLSRADVRDIAAYVETL